MQHERGVELTAVRGAAGILEVLGEIEIEDVDGEDSCPLRPQGREGFLVGIVTVRGKNDESIHATLLP